MATTQKEYKKEWYKKNKTRLLKKYKEYNEENKDDISKYQKNYRSNYIIINKEKLALYQKEYQKNRCQTDSLFKLRHNCSCMISQALKGKKNNSSILDYLPYSMEDLKKHLENQFDSNMTWENYGKYWHIDHICPQSLLPYASMEDDNFKKCWALNNLQPLEAIANIKKSNKY